jgi:hypothetical protein
MDDGPMAEPASGLVDPLIEMVRRGWPQDWRRYLAIYPARPTLLYPPAKNAEEGARRWLARKDDGYWLANAAADGPHGKEILGLERLFLRRFIEMGRSGQFRVRAIVAGKGQLVVYAAELFRAADLELDLHNAEIKFAGLKLVSVVAERVEITIGNEPPPNAPPPAKETPDEARPPERGASDEAAKIAKRAEYIKNTIDAGKRPGKGKLPWDEFLETLFKYCGATDKDRGFKGRNIKRLVAEEIKRR